MPKFALGTAQLASFLTARWLEAALVIWFFHSWEHYPILQGKLFPNIIGNIINSFQKHLSQFTPENVPKHKFSLEMVPKYKFTHENLSNVNKQLIVNKQLKVNKLPIWQFYQNRMYMKWLPSTNLLMKTYQM